MGGFRAVEDRPTPKEVYNWRLYLEAAVISFGSLLSVIPKCTLLLQAVAHTQTWQVRLRLSLHRNDNCQGQLQERL